MGRRSIARWCGDVFAGSDPEDFAPIIAREASRRRLESEQKGHGGDFESVRQEIENRDHRDITRDDSPLRVAHDAVIVESGGMTDANKHISSYTHISLFDSHCLPSRLHLGAGLTVARVRGSRPPDSADTGSSTQRCYADVVAPTVYT